MFHGRCDTLPMSSWVPTIIPVNRASNLSFIYTTSGLLLIEMTDMGSTDCIDLTLGLPGGEYGLSCQSSLSMYASCHSRNKRVPTRDNEKVRSTLFLKEDRGTECVRRKFRRKRSGQQMNENEKLQCVKMEDRRKRR